MEAADICLEPGWSAGLDSDFKQRWDVIKMSDLNIHELQNNIAPDLDYISAAGLDLM